jgi:hypothetical protein
MRWVVNASPVILLAKINQADLLPLAAPLISALKSAGAHISDVLTATALQLAEE